MRRGRFPVTVFLLGLALSVAGRPVVQMALADEDGEPPAASAHWATPALSNCDGPCGPTLAESPCACCDSPQWMCTADAMFLNRSGPAASVWAFNTANPAQKLNASDLNFASQAGFDLSLMRRMGSEVALELRYFGVEQWTASASAATTPGDLLQINADVPVFTFSGTSIDGDGSAQLHNAELNLHSSWNQWLDVLAGFRYAELDERGSLGLANSPVPFDYVVATRNRLYGGQVGGQAWLWSPIDIIRLDVTGKAGIFGNQAAQSSSYSTGLVTLPATGDASVAAFIGELGFNGSCQLTDRLALRAGYRLLWVTDVALASEQLSASDFANGSGFSGNGDVFYHGAFVGLEITR